ncbi:MAG: GPR endopeptidase [Clostridia bacterium]|nr:GPR endopeptidase [Clostridia bacterium]
MKKYIFTDLACEMNERDHMKKKVISDSIQKIISEKINAKGAVKRYITFNTPKLWMLTDEEFFLLKHEIISELQILVSSNCNTEYLKNGLSFLIVGLGNPHITSDSLGAETVRHISVTHYTAEDRSNNRIMAVTPDVMGNTGIDTVEAIKSYVNTVKPNIVIAIDSLRARSYERLASTVQLSDVGITPGGGIQNGKSALDRDTLGVPVISVGVPTVVNSSTMICEALAKCDMDLDTPVLRNLLDNGLDFLVTPKESDVLITASALLLASVLNDLNEFI